MIKKDLLIEKGFVRVVGTSVWHHGEADVYVVYSDIVINGEVTKLDGRKDSEKKLEKIMKKELDASFFVSEEYTLSDKKDEKLEEDETK